jgi:protein-S-isoprenylcysteine O-methyltransferase Ste14
MSESLETKKLNRYGYNAIARQVFTAILSSIILFLAAGTTEWAWGWVFSAVYLICWLGLSVAVAFANPRLLNERGKPTGKSLKAAKSWDKILLSVYSLLLLVQPLVAGLDKRFGWSSELPSWVYLLGNVLLILAFIILAWSMIANRFFEAVARIQSEKNQEVVSIGPYRYIRHPGYLSVIISFLAIPLALGSWPALLLGLVGAVIFVIRTNLEDKMLLAELEGYSTFSQKTPYRLIPLIW